MARGRRRTEWDKWGQLLALVNNKLIFSESEKPTKPIDYWPSNILTDDDRIAYRQAANRPLPQITGKDLQRMMGLLK